MLISDPRNSLVDSFSLLADVPDHGCCRVESFLLLSILWARAIFLDDDFILRVLGRLRPSIAGASSLLAGLVRDFIDNVDGFLGWR